MNFIRNTQKKRKKVVKDIGGKALRSVEKLIAEFSKVPTTPFLNPYQFEWTPYLEKNWETIRDELIEIMKNKEAIPNFQDISKDQESITKDNDWKTYFLFGFGYKAGQNCERCPKTVTLIEKIPGMITAFFSILKPGKHIPVHRGLYKGFLRYHLGLIVPEPNEKCRIRVADTFKYWTEGKSMMFDDTYLHEVWNNTGGVRVVLFMDILRPMRFPVSIINKIIINIIKHTGYVQDARKNQQMWAEKFEKEAS